VQVKGISNSPLFVKAAKNTKPEANTNTSSKDRIEISSEARDLAKTDLSAVRLEEIRTKLAGGFYNSPEVLDKLAEKLSKDLIK